MQAVHTHENTYFTACIHVYDRCFVSKETHIVVGVHVEHVLGDGCFCNSYELYVPWGELYKSDADGTTPKRNPEPNPFEISTLRSNFLAFYVR